MSPPAFQDPDACLPGISLDGWGWQLVSLIGHLTPHRSNTVFAWVHQLTIAYWCLLSGSSNSFLASGLLTFHIYSQEVIAHQSMSTLKPESLWALVANSLIWKTKRKTQKNRTESHLTNDCPALCPMVAWEKASVCARSHMGKLFSSAHWNIRDQNVTSDVFSLLDFLCVFLLTFINHWQYISNLAIRYIIF